MKSSGNRYIQKERKNTRSTVHKIDTNDVKSLIDIIIGKNNMLFATSCRSACCGDNNNQKKSNSKERKNCNQNYSSESLSNPNDIITHQLTRAPIFQYRKRCREKIKSSPPLKQTAADKEPHGGEVKENDDDDEEEVKCLLCRYTIKLNDPKCECINNNKNNNNRRHDDDNSSNINPKKLTTQNSDYKYNNKINNVSNRKRRNDCNSNTTSYIRNIIIKINISNNSNTNKVLVNEKEKSRPRENSKMCNLIQNIGNVRQPLIVLMLLLLIVMSQMQSLVNAQSLKFVDDSSVAEVYSDGGGNKSKNQSDGSGGKCKVFTPSI